MPRPVVPPSSAALLAVQGEAANGVEHGRSRSAGGGVGVGGDGSAAEAAAALVVSEMAALLARDAVEHPVVGAGKKEKKKKVRGN